MRRESNQQAAERATLSVLRAAAPLGAVVELVESRGDEALAILVSFPLLNDGEYELMPVLRLYSGALGSFAGGAEPLRRGVHLRAQSPRVVEVQERLGALWSSLLYLTYTVGVIFDAEEGAK